MKNTITDLSRLKSSVTIRLLPKDQLSFWKLLNQPALLTKRQRDLALLLGSQHTDNRNLK